MVILRIVHGGIDLLTPYDLRAETFTVNVELSADFHGHTQKNFEPKRHFGTFYEFFF